MSVVHFEIFPFDFIKKLKISVLSDNNSIDNNSKIYENMDNSENEFLLGEGSQVTI